MNYNIFFTDVPPPEMPPKVYEKPHPIGRGGRRLVVRNTVVHFILFTAIPIDFSFNYFQCITIYVQHLI